MTTERIREAVIDVIPGYPVKRVSLFGSYVSGRTHDGSDIDLLIEFSQPVSLMTLSMIRMMLEERLGTKVDVIHGPLRETDLIEIDREIELYAA